jgi:precorrin-6B methylase 1
MKSTSGILSLVDAVMRDMPRFDLACVGTSILGFAALTLDSLACLVNADIVYYYPPTDAHMIMMKIINQNIVNLNSDFCKVGDDYEDAYRRIIEEVLGSVKAGRRVAYAQQGSPAFLSATSVALARAAGGLGYSVLMVPGVSSFDLALSKIYDRYDVTDVQLYNCHSLMEGALEPDPAVPCFLFNLGRWATESISRARHSFVEARIGRFVDKIRAIYGADFRFLIMDIVSEHKSIDVRETGLDDSICPLVESRPHVTLFLPPARRGGD